MAYLNALSTEKHSKDLKLPMSYTALAQYLTVDRSAMTRELKNLEKEGILTKKRKEYPSAGVTGFSHVWSIQFTRTFI